jgi:cytochrome c biogenesis protein CcmG, thiol:disulfide interchange protein DsbE
MTVQRFPSVSLLLAPRATLAQLVASGRDSNALFGMLLLEAVIIYPGSIASALARVGKSPMATLSGLAAVLLQHMLVPVLGIFALSLALSLAGRRRHKAISLSVAAGVLGYAWAPHVVLTAMGALLAGVGLDSALLPHHLAPLAAPGLRLLSASVGLAPTTWLLALAIRELWRGGGTASVAPQLRRLWAWPAALVGFGLVAGFGGTLVPRLGDTAEARLFAPFFELRGLDGDTLRSHDLLGSVAMVDFWASWCPPCLAAMPHMQRLHEELRSQGFKLVSVNVEADAPGRARAFKAEHDLSFPVYLDAGAAQRAFGVTSYPTVVLIDRQGRICKTYSGAIPVEELRAALKSLMAE